ncbi:MAG: GLPGLI family protein [Flavobacteriaceae bacterium]|nr:GLPGLI family protein [Flavobacteriaceae bacterium]
MIKKVCLIILLIQFKFAFSQNTTVINFEEKVIVSKEMLQKAPPMLREVIQKQLNNTIVLSIVKFKKNIVYYSNIETNKQININGKVAKKNNVTLMDTETSIRSKKIKIKKDFIKQNYTVKENNKLVTKSLEKVKWVITKKTKQILNYNCYLALTTFKGQKLEVYFTKEITGNASPEKLPFINGVILEYSTATKTSIATQVQFNQPDIKNYFEE